MSNDKMREEFEAWAITCAWLGLSDECMEREETGYVGLELHAAWLAWQASRAAVVVELPKIFPDDSLSLVCSKYSQALEAAGLKVKP